MTRDPLLLRQALTSRNVHLKEISIQTVLLEWWRKNYRKWYTSQMDMEYWRHKNTKVQKSSGQENKYRLLHIKCDVRIFTHDRELQNFGKRTSERSEWIKIRTKHFRRCNLLIIIQLELNMSLNHYYFSATMSLHAETAKNSIRK